MLERWLERIEKGSMVLSFGEYAQQRANRQFIDLPLLDLPTFQVRDGPKYGFARKYKSKAKPTVKANKHNKEEIPQDGFLAKGRKQRAQICARHG